MPTIPEKLTQIETLTIMLRAAGIAIARKNPEAEDALKVLDLIADSIENHASDILRAFTATENPITKELQ